MNTAKPRGQTAGRSIRRDPLTAYELVTRRAVEDMERELARIDMKVNALVVGMVGTFAAEIWRAFLR